MGEKRYAMTYHLGKVLAVKTDRQKGVEITVDIYAVKNLPNVNAAQDYDPGGMLLVGRSWVAGSENYRFGFNSYENDDEVKGDNLSYSTFYRGYDPRLGRWLSLDPLDKKYPNFSPYCSFKDNPLYYVDVKGDDIVVYCSDDKTTPILTIVTDLYKGEYTLPDWIDCRLLVGTETYELEPFTGDAYLISFDASFALGGGASAGFSIAIINSGEDLGGVFLYGQAGGTIGLEGGVSVVGGEIHFNEDNSAKKDLTRNTFEGKSQGASGSFFWFSTSTIKSYVDNEWHENLDERPDILYEGTLVGGGAGAGGAFYYTEAKLLETIIQPIE